MKLHTLVATFLIFSQLVACSLFQSEKKEQVSEPVYALFEGDFDEVWRAIQKATRYYPIRLNNIDTGHLETEILKPNEMWQPQHEPKKSLAGQRQVIKITATRGFTSNKKEAVRVGVERVISLEKDFFSGEQRIPSDGLEEKLILYRIRRELSIERSIKKAFDDGRL